MEGGRKSGRRQRERRWSVVSLDHSVWVVASAESSCEKQALQRPIRFITSQTPPPPPLSPPCFTAVQCLSTGGAASPSEQNETHPSVLMTSAHGRRRTVHSRYCTSKPAFLGESVKTQCLLRLPASGLAHDLNNRNHDHS